MENYGFKLIKEINIDNKKYGLEQTYIYEGVTIDLFYFNYDYERMWTHAFVSFPNMTSEESINKKGGYLPIEQYFPLCKFEKISFIGEKFYIPEPAHDHLSFHYGEDYKIPRKWDYMDLENDNVNAIYLYDKLGKVHLY